MNTLILNVKGKNIDNFIHKLYSKKIDILKIKYINRNEIIIEIKYDDYKLIDNVLYETKVIKYKGIKRIKEIISNKKYFLISLLIGIIILLILTNTIYKVDIIYSGTKLRNTLKEELKKYGIKEYTFAKKFDELDSIKNQILIDYKDTLEWLMIERVGTKYIIRLEPRKINNIKENDEIYNVVSKKDAIIKKIEASSGEIIRNVNDYVKKGDIIISNNITLNDNIKSHISASGKIYGETWYKVSIEYPLNYYEEKETGNKKVTYNIKIFDRYIGLNPYKNKKIENQFILKSDLFDIGINKQIQKEIEIINYKLSYEKALEYAKKESRKKIQERLNEEEYIIDEKDLKCELKDSKIVVDMFYTVYEDITGYVKEVEYDISR